MLADTYLTWVHGQGVSAFDAAGLVDTGNTSCKYYLREYLRRCKGMYGGYIGRAYTVCTTIGTIDPPIHPSMHTYIHTMLKPLSHQQLRQTKRDTEARNPRHCAQCWHKSCVIRYFIQTVHPQRMESGPSRKGRRRPQTAVGQGSAVQDSSTRVWVWVGASIQAGSTTRVDRLLVPAQPERRLRHRRARLASRRCAAVTQ
jgi:hypothetical protein